MSCVEERVKITNRNGIHARPSHMIASTAQKFKSSVKIIKSGFAVDAKSILDLLMLAAEFDTELVIKADGPDAAAAVKAVKHLIETRFGELEVDQ
jgi:phosphocarrier protein HPr